MGASPAASFQLNCFGWLSPARNLLHAISIPEREPFPTVLMVDSICDPATPFTWGMQLREEIGGDKVVFITKNMSGHAVYEQPSSVGGGAARAIDRYFVDLILPQDGAIFQS